MPKTGKVPDQNDCLVIWAMARKGKFLKQGERIPDHVWKSNGRVHYCEALVVLNETIAWSTKGKHWLKAVAILKKIPSGTESAREEVVAAAA